MSLVPRPCDFESYWRQIRGCLESIMNNQTLCTSVWSDCFQCVYNVCALNPGVNCTRLYNELKLFTTNFVLSQGKLNDLDNSKLLRSYLDKWQDYYRNCKFVSNLFRYLNLKYISDKRQANAMITCGRSKEDEGHLLAINGMLLRIWQDNLLKSLADRLMAQLLTQMADDREGIPMDVNSAYGVIRSFLQVKSFRDPDATFYENDFEPGCIKAAVEYYSSLASMLFSQCTVSEYIEAVVVKLNDESRRCRFIFPPGRMHKLVNAVWQVCVEQYHHEIYAAIPVFLEEQRKVDLLNIHRLFKTHSVHMNTLKQVFYEHVKTVCVKSITAVPVEEIVDRFADVLLKFCDKYSAFADSAFDGSADFVAATKRACLAALSVGDSDSYPLDPAIWLAKYADKILGDELLSVLDFEMKFAKVVKVLPFVDKKDRFRQAYLELAAKRLLRDTSHDVEAEQLAAYLLKDSCGFEFENNYKRMINDRREPLELSCSVSQGRVVDMSVLVIKPSAWPLSDDLPVIKLTPEMQRMVDVFTSLYGDRFKDKKIVWKHAMGTVEVVLHYLAHPCKVTVSVPQYYILKCFDFLDVLTNEQIVQETGFRPSVVNINLRGLFDSGILIQTPSMEEDAPSDSGFEVMLNKNFTYQWETNKMAQVQMGIQRTAESTKSNAKFSALDDKVFLQCAVVRLMKTHKLMKHEALVEEAIRLSKGRKVNAAVVKGVIEDLIDKNYLNRTGTLDEYAYLP